MSRRPSPYAVDAARSCSSRASSSPCCWASADGPAYTLLTAASTDDDAARQGLARIQGRQSSDDFGFVVADGHVLIARGDHGAQAAAEAAHAEAAKTPLSGVREIAEIQAELADGLSLTKALKALDSARLTFAVTELGDLLPTLFAALDAKDATVAKDLANALKAMEVPLTVTVQGSHVEAVAQGYPGSSKLADNPLFQQAIAGLPAKPDAAVYVDVTRLLEQADADAETRSTAAPIKAIAVATAPLGADTGGMLRIVIQ